MTVVPVEYLKLHAPRPSVSPGLMSVLLSSLSYNISPLANLGFADSQNQYILTYRFPFFCKESDDTRDH